MIKKINAIIQDSAYQKEFIYFISSIDSNNGFLLSGDSVWFISKNYAKLSGLRIKTQVLNLITDVFISANDIEATFANDYYNIIEMTDYRDEEKLKIFSDLCNVFVNNTKINIREFFNSLIEMFKNIIPQEGFDIIGFFGEIYFIKYFFEKQGINLSSFWHSGDSSDKYDFSLNGFSIEVKTTTSQEFKFVIKHSQLFSSIKTIVTLLRIFDLPNGTSAKDIIEYFQNNKEFSQILRFQIALNREVLKIKNHEDLNRKFGFFDINFFTNDQLETIEKIPLNISNVSYTYDFSGQAKLGESELLNSVKLGATL